MAQATKQAECKISCHKNQLPSTSPRLLSQQTMATFLLQWKYDAYHTNTSASNACGKAEGKLTNNATVLSETVRTSQDFRGGFLSNGSKGMFIHMLCGVKWTVFEVCDLFPPPIALQFHSCPCNLYHNSPAEVQKIHTAPLSAICGVTRTKWAHQTDTSQPSDRIH